MSFTLRATVLLLLLLLLLLGYHTPEGIHFIIETGKRCFAIRSLALFHSPSPFLSLSFTPSLVPRVLSIAFVPILSSQTSHMSLSQEGKYACFSLGYNVLLTFNAKIKQIKIRRICGIFLTCVYIAQLARDVFHITRSSINYDSKYIYLHDK